MKDNRFSDTLKYIRKHTKYNNKIGMTMEELGETAHVSNPYISQLEKTDSKKKPSHKILKKLATGLTTQSDLDSEIMSNFLIDILEGNEINPDKVLEINNSLSNTHYVDFLKLVLSPSDADKNNIEFTQINENENSNNNEIVHEYKQIIKNQPLRLDRILNDKKAKVVFENQLLTENELNLLKSYLIFLKSIR